MCRAPTVQDVPSAAPPLRSVDRLTEGVGRFERHLEEVVNDDGLDTRCPFWIWRTSTYRPVNEGAKTQQVRSEMLLWSTSCLVGRVWTYTHSLGSVTLRTNRLS